MLTYPPLSAIGQKVLGKEITENFSVASSGRHCTTLCLRFPNTMFAVFVLTIISHIVGGTPSFGMSSSQQSNGALLTYDELLTYYHRFWDAFIFPESSAQLQSVNSSLFAENVVGRVDVTRTYIGRELNTEYIFGSFSDNSFNPNVQTFLGAPLAHQTIHVAAQDGFISSAELVLFNTSLISKVIPVEIYLWMLFNGEGEIEQYDITFRWFDWLFQSMVNTVQQDSSPNNEVTLSLQLAREVCRTSADYCAGSNAQYSSCDQCQEYLTNKVRLGAAHEFGRNTLLCRHLHAKILPLRPEVHCPHIGPTGGDMCVDDLTYQEAVLEPTFFNKSGKIHEMLKGMF